MHRLQPRTYLGQPGETVSISTKLDGGGQVGVSVNGQPVVNGQFQLPSTAGASLALDIALAGPQGATCVVGIAIVDGSADPDFLMCTTNNPAPVHQYSLSVAPASAVVAFAAAKAEATPTAATASAPVNASAVHRQRVEEASSRLAFLRRAPSRTAPTVFRVD